MNWDALVQGERPLEPDASVSLGLPHVIGGPIPDKVEVAAGVWADGDTFGRAELVKIPLANRALREAEYDQAASLLQQGLEQNCTRDQYMAALSGKPDTGPIHTIRTNLETNQRVSEKSQNSRGVMQAMLRSFTEKRDLLREAKPQGGVTPNP